MKRQSLAKIAFASCAVAVSLMTATPVFANPVSDTPETEVSTFANNADTGFAFNLGWGGKTGTGFRRKDDSSSLYIKILGYSGNPLRLYVDGAYDNNGSGAINCTQGVYRSNHKGEWEMWNLVKENGRHSARLTSWAESGPGSVNGVWSPDCVGHFQKLPA
ncbi:MAG: hypothetical protein Q4B77_03670 [Coriobacteriaceae bacterium]|nr:hypothetical protein [Coriobacteriaceae bacterium]